MWKLFKVCFIFTNVTDCSGGRFLSVTVKRISAAWLSALQHFSGHCQMITSTALAPATAAAEEAPRTVLNISGPLKYWLGSLLAFRDLER